MKVIHAIIALTLFLVVIGGVSALPIVLDEVEIDDIVLRSDSVNRL